MSRAVPSLMDMLTALIAAPSVSSVSPQFDHSNRAVIDLLAAWTEALGFTVEIQAIAGHPGKSNLIATLGRGPGGLVLAGHTDTVPCDEALWQQDPFRLTERDQRLYGLGTSDMKSFLGLTVEAAARYADRPLAAPLILLATADEESSMCGAQAIADAGRPLGRYAVIGEPTGLRPVRMHKGIMMEAIRLHGRSGHSSDPALGANALEAMHRVLGEILRWRDELQATHRHPAFKVPVPTLNLGHIHGGDNPNRICGDCELHIDLRPLPGMALEELRAALRGRVAQAVHGSGVQFETVALFSGIPSVETPAQSAIVRAAEKLTGHTAEAVAFGTEAPYLNSLGMDTLILGPGDIEQAHQPDEFLAMDRLQPTVDVLCRLIEQFCLTPQAN